METWAAPRGGQGPAGHVRLEGTSATFVGDQAAWSGEGVVGAWTCVRGWEGSHPCLKHLQADCGGVAGVLCGVLGAGAVDSEVGRVMDPPSLSRCIECGCYEHGRGRASRRGDEMAAPMTAWTRGVRRPVRVGVRPGGLSRRSRIVAAFRSRPRRGLSLSRP